MSGLSRLVRAFAPGSIGNLGPGLDVLGLAVAGAGDEVTAERTTDGRVTLADPGHPDLPADPARHACALAAREVLTRAYAAPGLGVRLTVAKGLPLAGGQGGSAASAVAAAVAVNALLGMPLDSNALLIACLEAESTVAGRHLDNLAPSLLGGCVLVRSMDPLDVVKLQLPLGLRIVLAHPAQHLRTRESRAVLPREVPLAVAIHQCAQVGAIVAALASGDLHLLGRAIDDRIAEPARGPLLPGFAEAKRAALEAGALGVSISGSGPTAFALAGPREDTGRIAAAMRDAYARAGLTAAVRVADVDRQGARVLGAEELR